jgi:hypothetical protein
MSGRLYLAAEQTSILVHSVNAPLPRLYLPNKPPGEAYRKLTAKSQESSFRKDRLRFDFARHHQMLSDRTTDKAAHHDKIT